MNRQDYESIAETYTDTVYRVALSYTKCREDETAPSGKEENMPSCIRLSGHYQPG